MMETDFKASKWVRAGMEPPVRPANVLREHDFVDVSLQLSQSDRARLKRVMVVWKEAKGPIHAVFQWKKQEDGAWREIVARNKVKDGLIRCGFQMMKSYASSDTKAMEFVAYGSTSGGSVRLSACDVLGRKEFAWETN